MQVQFFFGSIGIDGMQQAFGPRDEVLAAMQRAITPTPTTMATHSVRGNAIAAS